MSPRILVLLLSLSGCYFYYPDIPKTPRPALVDGEQVEMEAQEKEYSSKCDPTTERNCGLSSRGEWKKKRHYTVVEARYNGRKLNQFELHKLVDPEFDNKLARIRSNKGVCNVSLVPSAIAVIGVAAMMVAAYARDSLDDNQEKTVGLAAAGTAAGGALLSYPLGGFACVRAKRQYEALFSGIGPGETRYELDDDTQAYTDALVKMSKDFNARFGKRDEPEANAEQPEPSD